MPCDCADVVIDWAGVGVGCGSSGVVVVTSAAAVVATGASANLTSFFPSFLTSGSGYEPKLKLPNMRRPIMAVIPTTK